MGEQRVVCSREVLRLKYTSGEICSIRRNGTSFEVVASELARSLGYNKVNSLLKLVDEKYKSHTYWPTEGGRQKMVTISEPGVYQVLGRSEKPAVKPFQEWFYEDVLPSIRRDGFYLPSAENKLPALAVASRPHIVPGQRFVHPDDPILTPELRARYRKEGFWRQAPAQ